ncbi:hypothetical protein TEQG_05036 [Trichophyton equinum CBS 127.97]|uniref:Uncharacterized protein n=1 Tax=Trichophyton equinum (strain ATCC MYA-4606 / CBS 127.97) TaxID=559882 RepID=F2PW72_TRIEC|nr:hypothetical protein TEQG_05036 [Trichophyton equinum CBS 127.97]
MQADTCKSQRVHGKSLQDTGIYVRTYRAEKTPRGSSRGKAKQSKVKQRRGKAKKKEKEKKGKTEKMLKARRWIGRHLRREDEDEMHQGRVVRPTRVSTLMLLRPR